MESWMGWLFVLCCHFMLFYISFSLSLLCHPHDTFALLQFKNSFTVNTTLYDDPDSNYSYYCHHIDDKTATWENSTDCCSWVGVTCHPISGHVIALDLSCSGLQGQIHPNSSLFSLDHLQSLNLALNDFSNSQFSSRFAAFVSLTSLNLSYSYFEDEIPSQISHLSKLQSLDLSGNYYKLKWAGNTWRMLLQNATVLRELVLDETDMSSISMRPLNMSSSLVTLSLGYTGVTGKLTDDFPCLPHLQELYLAFNDFLEEQLPNLSCSAASLRILDLSENRFQGPIPASFSNLTLITSLDLSVNYLSGSIPASFSNLTLLTSLDLSGTNLNGSIPASFSNLTLFTSLHLSNNNLNGSIPASFSNLTLLTSLDLSNNNLSGSIPASFSNLLTSLHLYGNNLNGSIPSSLLTLPRLTFLDLRGNQFTGQIPNVFPWSNKFQELHLSDNKFGGELPSTLSNLQHLTRLDLSYNKLSGQIPDAFVGLTKLYTVDLRSNNLEGQIPSSLFDLTQLFYLYLSDNKLEGHLPNQITGSSNLTELWLNNNLLNGTIPSWCLSLPYLVWLDLSNNQFSGQMPAISSLSLESLSLCYNKLQGNIPQSILNLVYLTDLCLSSNNFTDPVKFPLFSNVSYSFFRLDTLSLSSLRLTEFPKLSGKVPMLEELDLSNNKLKGTVPKWLHEMDSLLFLNLSQNLLTAPINEFPWNYELKVLDLSFNSLTGGISSLICNPSSIEVLNLSHNKLTGIIPQCLVNLSSLQVVDLQMNKFCGSLPNSFSENSDLVNLNLNDNQLEGLLPRSLSNCTQLEVLNLANNQIEDTFPNWLQTLPNLKVLVLRANKLHGLIESSKSKLGFPSLVIFDISSNNFNGPTPKSYIQNFEAMKNVTQDEVADSSSQQYMQTPSSYGIYTSSVTETIKAIVLTYKKIPTNLVNIDLSRNKFEGEIPNVIGQLHALRGLNVSHNRLSGPIPQAMENLTNLESLDLSSNMLTGRIPTELVNLNSLEVFNLSHNRLVGEIPQGKQFDTFSNDSYEGNFGLCGVPLTVKCNKDPEQHSQPSENLWREEKFGFGWKPVAIGYGCGMLFGVGIGSCVFLTRKPQWIVRMVEG